MRVDRRGLYITVPQQRLNRPQVNAGFQQMGCKTVAQRVDRGVFVDSGLGASVPTNPIHLTRSDRTLGAASREQQSSGPAFLPILSQHLQKSGREHHVTVLAALALA